MDSNINLKFTSDDSDLLQTLTSIQQRLGAIENDFETLEKSNSDAFKAMSDNVQDLNNNFKKANETVGENVVKQSQLSRELKNVSSSAKSYIRDIQVGNTSLGQISDSIKKFTKGLKDSVVQTKLYSNTIGAVSGGFKGWIGQFPKLINLFKLLRTAVIGTGIGALVVGVIALIQHFKRTTEGADQLRKVFDSVGAVVDVLITRSFDLIKIMGQIITLDFSGAAAGIKSIGNEIVASVEAAQRLVEIDREITNERLNQTVQQAELNKEIKAANLLAEDTSKSLADREAAVKRSLDLNEQLLNSRQAFNVMEQDALRTRIGLEGDENAAKEIQLELAEKQAEFTDFETQALELQTTQNNKLNTIRREAATARQKAQDAEAARLEEINQKIREQTELFQEQLATLDEQVDDARFERLTDIEKLAKNRDDAITEVKKLREQIIEQAELLGTDLDVADVDGKVNELITGINREFDNSLGATTLEPLATPTLEFESANSDLGKIISKPIEDALGDAELNLVDKFEKFQQGIFDSLGIDDESFDVIKEQFGKVIEIVNQFYDDRIERQEQIIEGIDDEIKQQQKLVDRNQELADRGKANNLATEQERLEGLEEQRNEAEKKRRQAALDAQKFNLAVSTTETAASLTQGIANIIASEAKFGLAGIITAAAGIVGLFALFNQFKGVAAEQASINSLYDGGQIANHHSDDRYGEGLRVVDKNNNTINRVGGGEWVVNKQTSNKQHKFIKRLNNKEFDDVDLDTLINDSIIQNANSSNLANSQQIIIQQERDAMDYERMEKIYSKNIDRLISSQKEKTYYLPMNQDYEEITKNGKNTYRKKIKR
jgi:hypothetical protein